MSCNNISEISLSNFSKGVYFYCQPLLPPEQLGYSHTMICIAEGLTKLGIPVYSNQNFWIVSSKENQHLFQHNPDVSKDDCSVVVLDSEYFLFLGKSLPDDLFAKNREYLTVYLDSEDGSITNSWKSEFRQFDLILKNHMLEDFLYPENFQPWAFGLSERMISYLNNSPDFLQRDHVFHINFRNNAMFRHSVRTYVYNNFIAEINKIYKVDVWKSSTDEKPSKEKLDDYLFWAQTGRRHNPKYYHKLKTSFACACFSGFFVLDFPRNHATKISRISKRLLIKTKMRTSTIVQWDSWRFWESLAAGCISFQADFDKYSFFAPVKPENWIHYIGVNFDNANSVIQRIVDEPEKLEAIARNGKNWVMENYSPVPTASRFLQKLNKIK